MDARKTASTSISAYEKRNFTIVGAAEYLQVSRALLYRLIAAGRLQPTKLGRRTIITSDEINRLLADATLNTHR